MVGDDVRAMARTAYGVSVTHHELARIPAVPTRSAVLCECVTRRVIHLGPLCIVRSVHLEAPHFIPSGRIVTDEGPLRHVSAAVRRFVWKTDARPRRRDARGDTYNSNERDLSHFAEGKGKKFSRPGPHLPDCYPA